MRETRPALFRPLVLLALPLLLLAVTGAPASAVQIVALTETIALAPPTGTTLFGNTWAEGGLAATFKMTVGGIALGEDDGMAGVTSDFPQYFWEVGENGGPLSTVPGGNWEVDAVGDWMRMAELSVQVFYDPVYAVDNSLGGPGFITVSGSTFAGPVDVFAHADQSDFGNRIVAFGTYDIAAVPEPATLILFALGGAALTAGRRRRRQDSRISPSRM